MTWRTIGNLVTLVLVILVALLLMQNSYAAEPTTKNEEKQAFQLLVNKYKQFFGSNPKLLIKLFVKESPSSKCYHINKFLFEDILYDVQKTNSLVSPFFGFIDVRTKMRRNDSFGNVKMAHDIPGWDKIEDALRNVDNETYSTTYNAVVNRFNFVYQDGKWIFKNAIYADGTPNDRIMSVYGTSHDWFMAMDEPQQISFNQK
jgi:hypothetical protein